jgi:hypothetical protein
MLGMKVDELGQIKKRVNEAKNKLKKGESKEDSIRDLIILLEEEAKIYALKENNFSRREALSQLINKITEVSNNVYLNLNFYQRLAIRYEYINYLRKITKKNDNYNLNLKQVLLKHLAIIDEYDEQEFNDNEKALRNALGDLPSSELKALGIEKKSILPSLSIDKIRVLMSNGYVKARGNLNKYINGQNVKTPNDYLVIEGFSSIYDTF